MLKIVCLYLLISLGDAFLFEESGNYSVAIEEYRKFLKDDLISDFAHYRIGFCFQKLGIYDSSLKYYKIVVDSFPFSSFYIDALLNIAECYYALSISDSAVSYFVKLMNFSDDYKDLCLFRLGTIFYRRKEPVYLNFYLELAREYPTSPYCLYILDKLPRDSAYLKALILYNHRKYYEALRFLRGTSKRELLLKAKCYFGLKNYRSALKFFELAGDFYNAGECCYKLKDYDKALSFYLKSGTKCGYAKAGELFEKKGDIASAIEYYGRSGLSYYLIRAGVLCLRLKKYEKALLYFKRVKGDAGLYWRYRVYSEMKKRRARALVKELKRKYPVSYYTYLLCNGESHFDLPSSYKFSGSSNGLTRSDYFHYKRMEIFLREGLRFFAYRELNYIKTDAGKFWLKVAKLLHRYGEDKKAIMIVERKVYNGGIPSKEIAEILYPLRYNDVIDELSVDKYLLLALIREESHFDPVAVSPANAIGLTQIIPSTGKQIAKEMGLRFSMSLLFDPVMNIKMGAYYLKKCLKIFGGEKILALAAYNAGPFAVQIWLSKYGGRLDEFVELIPNSQARNYVKKVLKSYWGYKITYGG